MPSLLGAAQASTEHIFVQGTHGVVSTYMCSGSKEYPQLQLCPHMVVSHLEVLQAHLHMPNLPI